MDWYGIDFSTKGLQFMYWEFYAIPLKIKWDIVDKIVSFLYVQLIYYFWVTTTFVFALTDVS